MPLRKSTIGFIINPNSGVERNIHLQDAVAKLFSTDSFVITMHESEYAGHATEIALELTKKNYSIVVAVGGDGTVNEVAKALVNTQTALGIVPKGSGNGLARACGIPLQMQKALDVIHRGYVHNIDVGMANESFFVSNAGVGFDAAITLEIKNEKKRGLKMYIRKTFSTFKTYKAKSYKICINGKERETKAFMISVANGNEFGNGFKIAPTATLNDGELDVMIIKPLNVFAAMQVAWRAWRGNLHQFQKVEYEAASEVLIENEELKHFQVDGELKYCDKKLCISIRPNALHVVVP